MNTFINISENLPTIFNTYEKASCTKMPLLKVASYPDFYGRMSESVTFNKM